MQTFFDTVVVLVCLLAIWPVDHIIRWAEQGLGGAKIGLVPYFQREIHRALVAPFQKRAYLRSLKKG